MFLNLAFYTLAAMATVVTFILVVGFSVPLMGRIALLWEKKLDKWFGE